MLAAVALMAVSMWFGSNAIPTATAQDCPDVEVIFARGVAAIVGVNAIPGLNSVPGLDLNALARRPEQPGAGHQYVPGMADPPFVAGLV